MTKVINLIGAPGVGKSTLMAMIFVKLKERNIKCEMVQEWVKKLIWTGDTSIISNQHYIITEQYRAIAELVGKVDYIVLDTSLVNYIYYNRTSAENVCNVEKTEKYAIDLLNSLENIFVFVKRNPDYLFENEGRIHTETQSVTIEREMFELVHANLQNVLYFNDNLDDLVNGILQL